MSHYRSRTSVPPGQQAAVTPCFIVSAKCSWKWRFHNEWVTRSSGQVCRRDNRQLSHRAALCLPSPGGDGGSIMNGLPEVQDKRAAGTTGSFHTVLHCVCQVQVEMEVLH